MVVRSLSLFACAVLPAAAGAGEPARLQVDAGLLLARPQALPTGLSTGLGAGVAWGERFELGARLAWSRATEYSQTHEVTHDDLRLRATGAVRAAFDGGALGLRLGLGGVAVHEAAARAQAGRAGLEGDDAEETAWLLAPVADLAATMAVRVVSDFGLALALGPTLGTTDDDGARFGFLGELGLTWTP